MTAPADPAALPPGWRLGDADECVGGCCAIDPSGYMVGTGSRDDCIRYAARQHEAEVRSFLDRVAEDAGVVLPRGYDADAVARDGVRKHGLWWSCTGPKHVLYRLMVGEFEAATVRRMGTVLRPEDRGFAAFGSPLHGRSNLISEGHDSAESAALDLWVALGPAGVAMPPLPEVQ